MISFYDVTKRLQDENYRKLFTKIITTNEQELMEVWDEKRPPPHPTFSRNVFYVCKKDDILIRKKKQASPRLLSFLVSLHKLKEETYIIGCQIMVNPEACQFRNPCLLVIMKPPFFFLSVVFINKITYQTQRRKLRILPSADEYLNFPFHSPHFGSLQAR